MPALGPEALGFWTLLAGQARTRPCVERFADQVGRIDTTAFTRRVRRRAPRLGGQPAARGGIGRWAPQPSSSTRDGLDPRGALIVAAGVWAASVHCLAH